MPSAKRENFFGPWSKDQFVRSESSGNIILKPKVVDHSHDYPKTAPSSPAFRSPIGSPVSTSPPSAHHGFHGLRRQFSSTFMFQIPEDREIDNITQKPVESMDRYANRTKYTVSNWRIILRLILWWPLLLIGIAQKCINFMMNSVWNFRTSSAPIFWFSAFLWLFWKLISFPLAIIKHILIVLHTPAHERNRKKRTILISGGSTLQALHLARNFYSTGARVVVFEFEGLFGLARFSTAVDKFYTIPKVSQDSVDDYITALCNIVEKEKPDLYIPTCSSSPAYFDSLARPHLELLSTKVFIPGAQEVTTLDDIGQILRKCEANNIPVPPHRVIHSKEELYRLYESGWTQNFRNVIVATGMNGIIERKKFILPTHRRDLKLNHEISEEKPWVVLRDVPGKHYVTCTTVKDSKVIANVTCAVQNESRNLIPQHNPEIEKWLCEFFEKVRFMRNINGHISFRFVKSDASGNLLTLGTRVGVTLSYLCYTGAQPRIVSKPCPHFERQNSGPIANNGRHFLPETIANTMKNPSAKSIGNLMGTVLDKREALFLFWDPLPYCAFYHFQLPFNSVLKFLHRRSNIHKHPHTAL